MDRTSIGQRLVELATHAMPPGWELPRKPVYFDCFGIYRRTLIEHLKDLERWETDGGRV